MVNLRQKAGSAGRLLGRLFFCTKPEPMTGRPYAYEGMTIAFCVSKRSRGTAEGGAVDSLLRRGGNWLATEQSTEESTVTHPFSQSRAPTGMARVFQNERTTNQHDPTSSDNLPKHRRIRGCGGASPGGSGQARQVFRPHHELPRDRRGAASASSARGAISHPRRTRSAGQGTRCHA